MRRTFLFLTLVVIQTTIFAGAALVQDAGSFSDDFTSFDTTPWSKGAHPLGRSYIDPANVDVSGGNLRIALPARSYEGGEVLTNDLLGYGSYPARIRLPNASGSITGFFLYKSPDYESEIDIELYKDSTRRIMFTTYAGGRQTHTEILPLPFEPTAGFHEYRFDYAPDAVTFYVDRQPMKTWNDSIPHTSMHLILNSCFPVWFNSGKPKKTTYTYVDHIDFVARP